MFKKVGKILYWLVVSVLIFIAAAMALTVFEVPGGYRLFVVQSGSMEPKVKTGSIVVVGKQNEYKVNDIITFLISSNANPNNLNSTVTHRIASIRTENNSKVFQTKGDANKALDRESIIEKQILGKVLFSIPFAGYAVAFSKTQIGFILFIVVPSTIIIWSELMKIKSETIKLIAKRRRKKLNLAEKAELEIGEEEIRVEKWYKRFFGKVFRK